MWEKQAYDIVYSCNVQYVKNTLNFIWTVYIFIASKEQVPVNEKPTNWTLNQHLQLSQQRVLQVKWAIWCMCAIGRLGWSAH